MMRPNPLELDTIAAVATAPGTAALGIVRISGPATATIVERVIRRPGGASATLGERASCRVEVVHPRSGRLLDQAMATWYCRPRSYTGEDTLELTCHGNPVVLLGVMQAVLEAGARAAEPGEFTRRAWLHGKVGLLEVEATARLFAARTGLQAQAALHQLEGVPGQALARLRHTLLDLVAELEATIDFPEDVADDPDPVVLARRIAHLHDDLVVLTVQARQGMRVTAGINAVLIGAPNVGKSSLLNALLGRDRAIVTPIPGTTRDTLDETLTLGDVELRLIDTAGLRTTSDPIEAIGVDRTEAAMAAAQLLIVVLDGSRPLDADSARLVDRMTNEQRDLVWVTNKCDLPTVLAVPERLQSTVVPVSAVTGAGLDALRRCLSEHVRATTGDWHNALLLGADQLTALERAVTALHIARENGAHLSLDLLLVHLRDALTELGIVTGDAVDDEILDRVFARFCIGK